MSFSINSNIAALMAQRRLAVSSARLSVALGRLASGQRINSASDDAAGLAIASTLRAETRVFAQGLRNINDAQSALGISQGALSELSGITIRMRELASQAANGTYSLTQRNALAGEAESLVDEFNRLVVTTNFNGTNLLDRSLRNMRIQGGYGITGSLNIGLAESLYRNVGDGTFQSAISHNSGMSTASDMVSADFNGDGILDLAVASPTGIRELGVTLGNGNGTFGSGISVSIGAGLSAASGLVAADFNNDGIIDLATSNGAAASISIALGNGNGTFKADQDYSTGTNARGIAIGDFNRDGSLDVVVGSNTDVKVALGTGAGAIGNFTSYNVGPAANISELAVGDLNEDTVPDLAVQVAGSPTVALLLGNADGSFGGVTSLSLGYTLNSVQIGDVNNDGRNDIVTASLTGALGSVFLGTGSGAFGVRTDYAGGAGSSNRVKLSDFDGDGYLDLLVGGAGTQSILLNDKNSGFLSKTDYSVTGGVQVVTGDFNGDGATDLVTTAAATGINFVYLANPRQTSQIGYLNLNSVSGAHAALDILDQILNRINLELGSIGSAQSRLEAWQNTLSVTKENYTVAESRIADADVAEESSQMIREQILQQTAASILGQANQMPRLALSLLQTG